MRRRHGIGIAVAVLAVVAGVMAYGTGASARPLRDAGFTSLLSAEETRTPKATATPDDISFTSAARKHTNVPTGSVTVRAATPTRTSDKTRTAPAAPEPPTAPAVSEIDQARRILAGLVAQHPILAGTTVEFGDAKGYQAISYYKSGRIVISTTHTASLSRILNHEIWHVIDWRDNGTDRKSVV